MGVTVLDPLSHACAKREGDRILTWSKQVLMVVAVTLSHAVLTICSVSRN